MVCRHCAKIMQQLNKSGDRREEICEIVEVTLVPYRVIIEY